ncbi:MAG: DUF4157 domain-containing protein [Moorea sp. SIO4E2]|nr:DUF4157 domain-containing protein [Moorena sp. SIO4E2]
MRTLESGQYQPETGRIEMGQHGKFSFGQPGDRSRLGANHGGQMVVQPKRNMVQRAAQPLTGDTLTYGESMRAERSVKENKTGLPDRLKAGIENLSGYSMDDVRVHYNSSKPAQLQALAYAQGTEIHVGPGQEKHLAHEAWHVVQQKQGRVRSNKTKNGERINFNRVKEREADRMGEKAQAVSGRVGEEPGQKMVRDRQKESKVTEIDDWMGDDATKGRTEKKPIKPKTKKPKRRLFGSAETIQLTDTSLGSREGGVVDDSTPVGTVVEIPKQHNQSWYRWSKEDLVNNGWDSVTAAQTAIAINDVYTERSELVITKVPEGSYHKEGESWVQPKKEKGAKKSRFRIANKFLARVTNY